METVQRRKAAMAMGTLPKYAGGGLIEGFKRAVGIAPESPELKAYKAQAESDRAAKAKPQPEAPKSAIGNYVGNSALDKRMKAADAMASGGPVEGPGTGTSDEIPIMASNGEYMIRAAAVEEIGTEVLDAINKLGDDNEVEDEASDSEEMQPAKFATGGLIEEKQGEYGRQMGELGASFGRGVGNVGRAMEVMGKTAVSAPGYGFSSNNPTAPSDAAPFPGSQASMKLASAPTPEPLASPNALTMMQRQVGNAGSGGGREPYQPQFPVRPTASFVTPAAPQESASTLYRGTGPVDQAGLDGIQSRQDNRDANAAQRMQYDSEVSAANAVNEWQANRGKSTARLAAEGKLAQDVRGDATTRYQSDNSLKGVGINAGANRYQTDMQRENNQGNLGVAQDRLANETSMSALDMQGKEQILAAQRNLADAKTPEARRSAMEMLAGLQGKGTQNAQDEYAYAPGGQEVDPTTQQLVTRPGVIFNKRTGQPGGQPQQQSALPPGMVKQIGTANGKPVYLDQNGKQVIAKG